MIDLASLPVFAQNCICFWAMMLCFLYIADGLIIVRQKRPAHFAVSVLGFAASYTFMQICRDLSDLRLSGTAVSAVTSAFASAAWPVIPLLLAALTLCGAALQLNSQNWRRSHISSASIKEGLDGLPAGICFYLKEGRCVLVNHRMNDISFMLLGRDLQNGALLWASVQDEPVRKLSDGTAVSFRHRVIDYGEVKLHELIADNISELYDNGERLREGNELTRSLSENMKAYGLTIDDTVRRQEVLQAKISIHDGLNRMMLAAQNSLASEDAEGRREVLRMWKEQSVLLRSEAAIGSVNNVVADLGALAAVIGIELVWRGAPLQASSQALSIFVRSAREAMTNAARHAHAERLFIDISRSADGLRASFTNDGSLPLLPLREGGGLSDLRTLVEGAGGAMEVSSEPGFRLSLFIPDGGE